MGLLGSRFAAVPGPIELQLYVAARTGIWVMAQFLVLIPSTILAGLVLAPLLDAVSRRNKAAGRAETEVSAAPAGRYRDAIFASIWTAVSLLPLFKVYTSEVHLLYSLVPFSILASLAAQYLWRRAKHTERPRVLRAVIGTALLIGIGDQALNYPNSIRIVTTMNDGMQQVANRIKDSVPPGSAIVGNALHLEDLRLLSGAHFVPYWTVESGIPYPPGERALLTRQRLAEFFRASRKEVYLLDMDYEFHPGKRAYHSHRFVNRDGIAVEKLWSTEEIRVRYFFLDPLKNYTPRPLTNVLFAPDLENDFYRGPARSGAPFTREIYVSHTLYKVLKVDP